MSFIASLEIDGESHKILDCNFQFNQPTGTNSKPSGKTQGGSINISLELHRNIELIEWMINSTITKSGSVVFYNRDSMSRQLTLEFENGYCTNLNADYHSNSNQPLKLSITITPEILRINSIEHKNNW